MPTTPPSPHQKALEINLAAAIYGAFAEIGAGQEVARWFFHVGGAAGTVAKTISAYDMAVSDAIYGPSNRYVSRQRLESMLSHEYALVLERLSAKRGDTSKFFAFANTVATRSHGHPTEGQGWMGLRFQHQTHAAPSQVIVHVNLHDTETVRQQEVIGLVGLNLIHAAFYAHGDPPAMLASLMDGLTRDRVEIDMIDVDGPAFTGVDDRLLSLQLVENGFTDAAMFTAAGETVQPSEVLYKKAVLVERGRFRPLTNLTLDLLDRAAEQFARDSRLAGETPLVLMEMTLRSLVLAEGIDHADFLCRVDALRDLGKTVLISNYTRYFRLVEYLLQYTQKPIGIAVGIPSLEQIGDETNYTDLQGGTLESIGRMFRNNVILYVYPYLDPVSGKLTSLDELPIEPPFSHLVTYLKESGAIQPIRNYTERYLPISADTVLTQIASGDPAWENAVPAAVVRRIKEERLFGWKPPTG